jgi:hypothetical protein
MMHVMRDLRFMKTVARNLRVDLADGLGLREAVAFAGLDMVRRMSKTIGLLAAYPRVSA